MVKKVINIGVEGNDASGDPIREAFNKVNENFNELYSAFGQGGGISITALEEGPDEVIANSILIANAGGTQYLSKTLEGSGGIEVINSDPSKIVINSASASLAADPEPSLSNHLDATLFNIVRLSNPNSDVAAAFNTTLDTFAINKGYADSRYVNISGDTMTGSLSVPSGAKGAEVPQAQEVILKTGGTGSQMRGPLILERKIRSTDNPLIAATKEYVDLGSYVSQVNLFVNTNGNDDQFDVPAANRGRSQGYAFKTISHACRYAQSLIDLSEYTVSITVKDITYSNGEFISRVQSITNAGSYYVLTITNNGIQTDPRDNDDIRPGQIIRGKTSGAIVRILEVIEGTVSNTESYKVEYVTETALITSLGGEYLEYGNPDRQLQITIFIESGNYYEHYPIRVPPNVSIVGDELRRVIVRPKPGRSASWAVDTYFRRDILFDNDLQVADRLYGYHYLTDSSKELYSETLTNAGNYINATSILTQNRSFIQEEVIGYVNQVWRGLQYDESKCRRDTGLIIEALGYDLMFNSNFNSISVARAYYRGTQAAAVLGADKTATLEALDELRTLLIALVSNTASEASITNNIALIKNIINTGVSNLPQISWDPTSDRGEEFIDARNIIYNNINFIQAEIVAYINNQIEANLNNSNSIWYNLEISGERCARDVGYIIEAVCYDLTYGGNLQSREAANAYYISGQGILANNEISPTLDAYDVLKTLVYKIVVGESWTVYQTSVPRISGATSTATSGFQAQALIDIVRFALQNNGSLPSAIPPSLTSVPTSLFNDYSLMISNSSSLQDDVIDYINGAFFIYNEDLCKRDVGLLVDALAHDLFYGGYYRSLEAANSYFESASALIAITDQLTETTAAINYLGTIGLRILQKLPPAVSYQNAYPPSSRISQSRSMPEIVEPLAISTFTSLIDFMVKIINQDSSFNIPKDNNQIDVFLLNNATIIRNISCQEHGGFMCVLDPLGQILTKSPYIQTSSSFSKSINERFFAGGVLVDAFAGNLSAEITSRISDTEITVSGLTVRLPNLPCAFYINGVRFQVDVFTNYNQTNGTANVHINPNTPDDPDYTLIEDSTRLFLPSTSIEFLSAGNNSMLCNDYTNLNDLGYGLVALNGGLLEAVSVFTYYCQASYLADSGGQIRSVGGSSAHGSFGLVSANSYPLERPDDIYLLQDMTIGASIYSPFDYYPGISGTRLSGSGINATFNVTVNTTSYVVTVANPGSGYAPGNQIVILGNEFGGIVGPNDLTITISTIGVGGTISTITTTGSIPATAPINIFYNRTDDTVFYIHNLTKEFQMPNGCLIEIPSDSAPNRTLTKYLVNNISEYLDVGSLSVAPTGKLYRVNLATGGLGAGGTGIQAGIPNNERVTLTMNTSVLLYDINRETATRPSTALVFDESTNYVNRVIAITNVGAKVGTFTWISSTATVTSEGHGLTNTIPPTEVYLVFLEGSNGNPPRGYYTIVNVIDVDTFTVTTVDPTPVFSAGSVSWGLANGECEAQLKDPFRSINMTAFYDSGVLSVQPFTVTITRSFSSTNEFACLSTDNITENVEIKFDGTVGGVVAGTSYYIKQITSDTTFTISNTRTSGIAGAVRPLSSQTASMYGSTDISGATYYTWGVTGSKKLAIRDVSEYDALRIQNGLATGLKILFGWRGRVHTITRYVSSIANGTTYAVLEIDDLTGPGLYEPIGLLEGGWESTPNFKGVLPKDSPGTVTIQISTVRATGHDFLDIGTGSYSQTNFPNIIFGRPERDPNQAGEVREIGKGRVFYATTDQDGNFKVGDFFKVDQGTGTVTFSSSIAISNLDGLGFKRGVAIAEFSIDDSMFQNATDIVPTEQAIRSYIDRRLGLTHNGAVISPASGRLIPNNNSGFMSLDGQLKMKADMDLNSFKIINLLSPTNGSDAANKAYADTKLSIGGGTMTGFLTLHADPTSNMHAATKKYVDDLVNAQDQLTELDDVTITGTPSNNSILAYDSTSGKWVNGGQAGDVLFTLAGNVFTSAIQPGVIINSDVKSDAAISQSKLELNLATTRASAPTGTPADKQLVSGVASFDSTSFNVTDGFVSLRPGGITLTNLPQIGADTVLGNSSASTTTPSAVTFATVVQEGGGLYNSLFSGNGLLARTGASTYASIGYQSTYSDAIPADKGTVVIRDASSGGFSGSILNATTQFNVSGNKVIGVSGTSPNQFVEFYSPQGNLFLDSRSGITRVQGSWTLGTGATLEATYAADIAEYYQGDKTYEPGTVLMIGGEFDVVLANGSGTTKVAGVVSTQAAYIMNGSCPGERNLIALQGRVPCKVIGKVEKGDLMVVGIVPGVAMASSDPKPGSIIGKALQNYNSDHVGIIEVMVGKH